LNTCRGAGTTALESIIGQRLVAGRDVGGVDVGRGDGMAGIGRREGGDRDNGDQKNERELHREHSAATSAIILRFARWRNRPRR
jgi:hypothetical protein